MAVKKTTDDGINIYPLDIAALEKGDFIEPEFCEQFTKLKRSDRRYSQALLPLRDLIVKGLHKLGRNWTVSTPKDGIKILTDVEAADYNRKEFDRHTRALGRKLRDNIGVDASLLPEDKRRSHEHDVLSESMQVAAMKRARRQLSLAAHKRTVPRALPSTEKGAS